jgi:hypothetical protein
MSGSATVTINPNPTYTVAGTSDPLCFGGSDGTITVLATGGSGAPYQFSSDNGVTWTTGSNPNPYTFTGLIANWPYKIRVMDSNGCTTPAIP